MLLFFCKLIVKSFIEVAIFIYQQLKVFLNQTLSIVKFQVFLFGGL